MSSYDEAGNQLWLAGSAGVEDGDIGATIPVILVEGPVWGTNFDPADAVTTQFGNITVRFPTCDSGLFYVESNVVGLESYNTSVIRLTGIIGMDCRTPPPTTSDVATPGQWTGEGICFFVNTEPLGGAPAGSWLTNSDLCDGFNTKAEIPGVEVNIKGEEGEACQATIECSGNGGITYPGSSTFGWVGCSGRNTSVEIYFTSATESILVAYDLGGQAPGTVCVAQGETRPAQ